MYTWRMPLAHGYLSWSCRCWFSPPFGANPARWLEVLAEVYLRNLAAQDAQDLGSAPPLALELKPSGQRDEDNIVKV